MSKVYFLDYSAKKNIYKGLKELALNIQLDKKIKPNSKVAVKLHMGELGNFTYLRPGLVRRVVEIVKQLKAEPFIADTTSLYPYKRFTAEDYLKTAAFNGFSKSTMNCPVIIADDEKYKSLKIPIKKKTAGCSLSEINLAGKFAEADFLLVLSHVKGHNFSGIGGALKNIAMGCTDKTGKAKQHYATRPILNPERCTGCGACVEKCAFRAINIIDQKAHISPEKCMFCNTCTFTCPNEALCWQNNFSKEFQILLTHAASAVCSFFKGNIAFFNFLEDITPLCDCCASKGDILFPDIGILASDDIVAIDKSSLDLIDKTNPLSENIPSAPDRLGKLHNLDSLVQFKTAEELNMGNLDYELVRI